MLKHIRQHCADHFRRFLRSERGITLPLLALAMVTLTSTVGIAIDLGRMQMVQSKLQFSLDAAGLAGGSTVSTANLSAEVTKYLSTNFNGYLGATVTGSGVTADSTNTVLTLSATATLPTTFLGVVGLKTITVTANSQVSRAVTGLELVLVLDNTGSMNDPAGQGVSKIQALQTAATSLVNTLYGNQTTVNNLWIGIVPFSQAVNIGTGHPTWMNTTYDATLDWGPSPSSWFGCVDARLSGEDVVDDPPVTSSTKTLFEAYYWTSDSLNTDGVTNSGYNAWKTKTVKNGVTTYSYKSPLNETTQGPNLLCPQQVTPMTNNKTTILNAISAMTAQGDTVIPQGMQWGWNMLSPRWQGYWGGTMNANGLPLAYHTANMNKVLVMLTDGENTIDNVAHGAYWFLGDNRLGTTNSTTAVSDMDSKTLQLCTAMKNNGISIYTIALGTDTTTSSLALLASCATAPNYYFNSPSTATLQNIFSVIGDSLANLRVSK